jgi:hypothetical protein
MPPNWVIFSAKKIIFVDTKKKELEDLQCHQQFEINRFAFGTLLILDELSIKRLSLGKCQANIKALKPPKLISSALCIAEQPCLILKFLTFRDYGKIIFIRKKKKPLLVPF